MVRDGTSPPPRRIWVSYLFLFSSLISASHVCTRPRARARWRDIRGFVDLVIHSSDSQSRYLMITSRRRRQPYQKPPPALSHYHIKSRHDLRHGDNSAVRDNETADILCKRDVTISVARLKSSADGRNLKIFDAARGHVPRVIGIRPGKTSYLFYVGHRFGRVSLCSVSDKCFC